MDVSVIGNVLLGLLCVKMVALNVQHFKDIRVAWNQWEINSYDPKNAPVISVAGSFRYMVITNGDDPQQYSVFYFTPSDNLSFRVGTWTFTPVSVNTADPDTWHTVDGWNVTNDWVGLDSSENAGSQRDRLYYVPDAYCTDSNGKQHVIFDPVNWPGNDYPYPPYEG